jgi:hypothetical protein
MARFIKANILTHLAAMYLSNTSDFILFFCQLILTSSNCLRYVGIRIQHNAIDRAPANSVAEFSGKFTSKIEMI